MWISGSNFLILVPETIPEKNAPSSAKFREPVASADNGKRLIPSSASAVDLELDQMLLVLFLNYTYKNSNGKKWDL